MTFKTVRTSPTGLGVTRSRSRPHISNENPYSEKLFKTMKYLPVFPDRFVAVTHARHLHIGIGKHTRRRALRPLLRGLQVDHPQRTSKTDH